MCNHHENNSQNTATFAVAAASVPTFKYGRDIGFAEMSPVIAEKKLQEGGMFVASREETFVADGEVVVDMAKNEIRVIVPAGVKITLTEKILRGMPFVEAQIVVVVGEGSEVCYEIPAEQFRDAMIFVQRIAEVAAGAKMIWVDRGVQCMFSQSWTETQLLGEGAGVQAVICAKFFGETKADLHTHVSHLSPRTFSHISTRVVADDAVKVVTRDAVQIGKSVVGCDARQASKVLLLSPHASCHAVPQLEIATDEVTAKHSASITKVDEAQIFALMSRGVAREEAKTMIVEGFLYDEQYAK
jgi:Fe-S cluster assembly scaffold protein SufB